MRAARHGRDAAVGMLAEWGANVHAASVRGHTPLHFAAYHGHAAVVKRLLAAGVRKGEKKSLGRPLLMMRGGRASKSA